MEKVAKSFGVTDSRTVALLTPEQLERTRRLRRQDTGAEQRLWARLRGRRLNGLKFMRQLPVGYYVVDFACRERMLVVEVDGATHGSIEEIAHDAARTKFLEAQGWRVLRAWNDDVVENIEGVMETILQACDSR